MITKKFLPDESGLTVAFETILLFAISVIFLGMIFYSFQDMNQRQSKILVEEELLTIGNSIAKQMSDITVEARASNTLGSHTMISSEFWIPYDIADNSYRVTLMPGKILLESTSPPYVSVDVPVNSDMNLAENSTIYSNDGKYSLEYDSKSSAIYFSNGGVVPSPDFNAPTISIDAPADGETISGNTYINVSAYDDVGVSRVEYYINGAYRYTAGPPYNWLWDTRGEIDANYTVTAVAYDAAGHTKPASRNYTVFNPFSYAPEIRIISPSDGENTTFKKPIIKAEITDDKQLNFSSIRLKINSNDQTSNSTFVNIPPKKSTLTYTPSQNMAIGHYIVEISAEDVNGTLPNLTIKTWTFNITDIPEDAGSPQVTMVYPIGATSLEPGSTITVTYLVSDIGVSGLENLTVNVMRSDGLLYKYQETISVYPNVVYLIDPQETWANSSNKYTGGMNYTYNITVFDRAGNPGIKELGPLTVSLPGMSSELEVDTSANYTQTSGTRLRGIRTKDNVSDSVFPAVSKMTVTWVPNSTERITSINFGGAGSEWSGSRSSGSQITLTMPYTVTPYNTNKNLDMIFNTDIRGKTFTIQFHFSDTTTSTVTFKAAT